jgi:hypothetical protein
LAEKALAFAHGITGPGKACIRPRDRLAKSWLLGIVPGQLLDDLDETRIWDE